MKSRILAAAAFAAFLHTGSFAQDRGAASPPPELSLEQAALLRCSAAFAIIAGEQERGDEAALTQPPLEERGREYFVRAGARLMDELTLTREGIQALFQAEVMRLQETEDGARIVDRAIGPCLLSLEASGI